MECFVERTHSTTRSTLSLPSPTAARKTARLLAKALVRASPSRSACKYSRWRRPLLRGGTPAVLGRTAGSSADADRSARYSRPQGRRWPTVTTCRGRSRDVARPDALRRPLSRSAANARDLIRPRPRRCSRSTRGHRVPTGWPAGLASESIPASRSDVRAAHGPITVQGRSCSRQPTAARRGRCRWVSRQPCESAGVRPAGRSG